MNLLAPVSSIMSSKLYTASPNDTLADVNEIFKKHKIHHLPVVKERKLVGMISKSDMNLFLKWWNNDKYQDLFNGVRLNHYTAEDIMTKGLAKLEPTDRINVAVKIFEENLFHAIPVVSADNELEGIITTYDMIKLMAAEEADRIAALKN